MTGLVAPAPYQELGAERRTQAHPAGPLPITLLRRAAHGPRPGPHLGRHYGKDRGDKPAHRTQGNQERPMMARRLPPKSPTFRRAGARLRGLARAEIDDRTRYTERAQRPFRTRTQDISPRARIVRAAIPLRSRCSVASRTLATEIRYTTRTKLASRGTTNNRRPGQQGLRCLRARFLRSEWHGGLHERGRGRFADDRHSAGRGPQPDWRFSAASGPPKLQH